jgi:hypothetical protein
VRINQYISHQVRYRHAFRDANPPGPWPCHFCGEPVEDQTKPFDKTSFVVHHADGDSANEAPDNLSAAHHGCHSRHHVAERWRDPKYRRIMTEGARRGGRAAAADPATRARVGAMGGKTNASRRRRCECGYEGRPSDLSFHRNRTGHRA